MTFALHSPVYAFKAVSTFEIVVAVNEFDLSLIIPRKVIYQAYWQPLNRISLLWLRKTNVVLEKVHSSGLNTYGMWNWMFSCFQWFFQCLLIIVYWVFTSNYCILNLMLVYSFMIIFFLIFLVYQISHV